MIHLDLRTLALSSLTGGTQPNPYLAAYILAEMDGSVLHEKVATFRVLPHKARYEPILLPQNIHDLINLSPDQLSRMVEEDDSQDNNWTPGKDCVFDAILNLRLPQYNSENESLSILQKTKRIKRKIFKIWTQRIQIQMGHSVFIHDLRNGSLERTSNSFHFGGSSLLKLQIDSVTLDNYFDNDPIHSIQNTEHWQNSFLEHW